MNAFTTTRFRDRREAGRALAARLAQLADDRPVVVALPRGGVPVGFELAKALGAPLDIGLVRKLGAPMQPELGIGALGETGPPVVDHDTVRALGITPAELDEVIAHETAELERRQQLYRPHHEPVDLAGRVVVVVDDGLATGVTAAAAGRVLRALGARRLILAVPVCPRDTEDRVRPEFDEFICLASPDPFLGVGAGYDDFSQTTDKEVIRLLEKSRATARAAEREVAIAAGPGVELPGTLSVPPAATGLVIFAHGSGSGRLSPRNRQVAEALNEAGLATLLFDLLTVEESADRANVFDIGLLGERLLAAHAWACGSSVLAGMPIGLFGASTGAAAALRAAAALPGEVGAVVSRGGRPDLAGDALAQVTAPTLLIVGGEDHAVLALNRQAAQLLGGETEIAIVPGATHLFEEPGALEEVQRLAAGWFSAHLEAYPVSP